MGDYVSKNGAMYRPATRQTYDAIRQIMQEQECSWNAAVNGLVLEGLRVRREAQHRNAGRF